MIHHKIDQNSDEWFNLRLGRFTASSFKDLFMSKSTAGYRTAINKVVFEKLTGEKPESFTNDYMQRGHELEPLARREYEKQTFETIEDGGFFSEGDWVGASPDGLVGEDGLIEIKCPSYSVMIQYLQDNKLPNIYKYQVHGQMYVTGRKWVHFCCYHPNLKTLIIKIDRDEVIIKEISDKLSESITVAKNIINKIK